MNYTRLTLGQCISNGWWTLSGYANGSNGVTENTYPWAFALKTHTNKYDHFFHNSLIARKVLDIRVHNVETKNK